MGILRDSTRSGSSLINNKHHGIILFLTNIKKAVSGCYVIDEDGEKSDLVELRAKLIVNVYQFQIAGDGVLGSQAFLLALEDCISGNISPIFKRYDELRRQPTAQTPSDIDRPELLEDNITKDYIFEIFCGSMKAPPAPTDLGYEPVYLPETIPPEDQARQAAMPKDVRDI